MQFVLRCFGAKHDSSLGQACPKQTRATTAPSQKHVVAATQGAGPVATRPSEPPPTPAVAVKVAQPEVAEPDQNGHPGSGGVVQVMAVDDGDRQAVDCSFLPRISLGSPLLLFSTPSVPTHHSLTLKLQRASRPGSSAAVVDNWVALGSTADSRATADSAERTTPGNTLLQQRQPGSRNDAPIPQAFPLAAYASSSVRLSVATSAQSDSQTQSQQAETRAPCHSRTTLVSQPAVTSSSGLHAHARFPNTRIPPAVGSPIDNARWSISGSNQAPSLSPGAPRRLAGGTAGGCSPAWVHSSALQAPRPLPVEELATLVSNLTRVRGHWLEALHTVVGLAAELLGADSLSLYLLSDSGTTHVALACHGDAGGAIRLGIPLPAVAPPGYKPTALQRLYQAGEPQRGSVWNGAAAVPNGPQLSGPVPMHALSATGPCHQQNSGAQGLTQGAALNQHRHHNDQSAQQKRQQQNPHSLHPPHHQQNPQQHPLAAALPPDWHAMRVHGGMTDFVAVPLLRGDTVIGALQVVDNCTPPEDITGAVPTSRRCRSVGDLSVVASFIGTLLVDHEVLCLMGALEAVASAQDVDGLVRALARHVGLFCCMRNHITPGVRVALIRGDAAALALFLDEGATAVAAAAGNLATGVAGGGSTTPVGVLSTAISRHSTACNLLQATFTMGGPAGLPSGSCTPEPRHIRSPGASTSGMTAGLVLPAAGRTSQLAAGGAGGGGIGSSRSVIPLYSPFGGTRDPSSILDTEQSLPAAASVGGVTGPAGLRAAAATSSSTLMRPAAAAAASEDAAGMLHVHGTASTGGIVGGGCGAEGLPGMAMSAAAELWPWFASMIDRAKGAAADGEDKGRGSGMATAAVAAVALDTSETAMMRCAGLAEIPSTASSESMLANCTRKYVSMIDDLPAPAAPGMDASGHHAVPGSGPPAEALAEQFKGTTLEPSLGLGLSASMIAAAAASGGLSIGGVSAGAGLTGRDQEPGEPATASVSVSASGHMSLAGTLLQVPSSIAPAIAQSRTGGVGGGLYGRALAMAGEELTASGGGRGLGQVQGHAMLTSGTVLAEALAAGTGMYISDVAIYMQDGRNKSRDMFLAPSGRGGPAQPTNSIAVTTISHAGLPLVGIYLTYSAPLPASLLNGLTAMVQAFGAMLGPLLHERLTSGDSELADEWRYLLGEVLDLQAIQSATDEQRSRRSSAALYIQQQLQQQQQPLFSHVLPPLTAPPSPLQILTGVAVTQSRLSKLQSRTPCANGSSAVGISAAGMVEAHAAMAPARPGRRQSGTGESPYPARSPVSRDPPQSSRWRAGGPVAGAGSGTATISPAPALRRSQTADNGALMTGAAASRANPSADGSYTAAPRSPANRQGLGSLRASVTADAAAKAVAASASEPAASVRPVASVTGELRNRCSAVLPLPRASGGCIATTIAAPPIVRYERGSNNRMPLAPPPSPLLPMVPGSAAPGPALQAPELPSRGVPAVQVTQGPAAERAASDAAASGPIWAPSLHLQQPQQLPSPQQQNQLRPPLQLPFPTPCHQQQQQQPLVARRLLNCSWQGPTMNGNLPPSSLSGSVASPSSVVGRTVISPASSSALKQEKTASESVFSSRNLDGGTPICVESRAGQFGSSNVSSGTAIVSRSTSGALGPTITGPPLASQPAHSDVIATDGLQTAIPVNGPEIAKFPGQLPSFTGAILPAAADVEEASDAGCDICSAVQGVGAVQAVIGRALDGACGTPEKAVAEGILVPTDSSIKVAETSPSAPAPEQERLLLHLDEDRRSPPLPWPAPPPSQQQHMSQQQQQQQQPKFAVSPFAVGCPASPLYALQPQPAGLRPAAGLRLDASDMCSCGIGSKLSPPQLRPTLTLPPPGDPQAAAAMAAHKLRRSPSVMSGSAAAPGAMSMSTLELSGHVRLLPAYLAAADSIGGLGGSAAAASAAGQTLLAAAVATVSSGSASASSHNMDVELSMQAWHLPTENSSRKSPAVHGSRNFPADGKSGSASRHGNKRMTGHDPVSASQTRLTQPRPYPAIPSPLSPGRPYHGVGVAAAAPPSIRRCSAGGVAPASPPPPSPPPRFGAGLSRLTTVATAAGVAGAGGVGDGSGPAGGGVAGPPPFPDAAARTPPNGGGFPGAAAGGGGAVAAAGLPPTKLPSPMVHRLRSSVRRNTSFNIMADPGVQDTGKVAPLMANLQDKLRTLQAEQVLARLHSKDASGADELLGLTVLEPLGSGGFGAVFRGIFNGIEVAVKVLCERGASGRSEAATMREAFELAVMTTISHPHIVQVLSTFTDVILATKPNPAGGPNSTTTVVLPRSPATEELGEPTVIIAMEYCDAGSLADAVSAGRFRQRVPGGYGALQPCMPAIYATLLEIALALRHMHAMLLVHCDLKPANILLKSNMRDPRGFSAKLSDFGLVKMVVEDGTGGGGGVIGRDARTGTVTHMAPELIRATAATKMDASVDIYAFGVLMWELLSTSPVYLGMRSEEIRRGVADGALRPEFPPWSDEKYRALAEACLSTDPKARPTSAELVARLRTLLAESGALMDTIMRRPSKNSPCPFPAANNFPRGDEAAAAAGGGVGFPGHHTAAAAGAMLGIVPGDFIRPSRLLPAQLQPPQFPLAADGPHGRRGRSRSCSGGNDSSTFPLHIL